MVVEIAHIVHADIAIYVLQGVYLPEDVGHVLCRILVFLDYQLQLTPDLDQIVV